MGNATIGWSKWAVTVWDELRGEIVQVDWWRRCGSGEKCSAGRELVEVNEDGRGGKSG